MEIYEMSDDTTLSQLTLFAVDHLAKTFLLPDSARAWLESDQDFGLRCVEFLQSLNRDGLSLRTSPACYPAADVQPVRLLEESLESTLGSVSVRAVSSALSALPESECLNLIADATLPFSFKGWQNSGIMSRGEFVTLSTTAWPSAAAVCSLSQVLETDVPRKYYLSAKAARGILRRAERRGKDLPEALDRALRQLAGDGGEKDCQPKPHVNGEMGETDALSREYVPFDQWIQDTKDWGGTWTEWAYIYLFREQGLPTMRDDWGQAYRTSLEPWRLEHTPAVTTGETQSEEC
jgi:hypothetical protein